MATTRDAGLREPAANNRNPLDEATTPLDPPPLCGLPRRFSMRGLLIIMTILALLMGLLRQCGAAASVYFMLVSFVVGTLAAQVVLFRGRSPTKASVWAGAVLLPLETLALTLYLQSQSPAADWFLQPGAFFVGCACMCAALMPVGAVAGAVAGATGGGLYLLSEEMLLWLTRGVPQLALAPIEDADADVLLRWISGPNLCWRWAGLHLMWPLDRQQLLDRFASARSDESLRCIFRAVDRRTGELAGYVELGHIDWIAGSADLELPLVDPDASERARLSLRLVQEIGKAAFVEMGLLSLAVADDPDQPELSLCCHEAWQPTCDFCRRPEDGDTVWTARPR